MFKGDKVSLDRLDGIAPAFDQPKITKDVKKKSAKIECRCKGKPEPKIVWKKDKNEIKETPNKYKISKIKEANDTYVFTLEISVSLKFVISIVIRIIFFSFLFRILFLLILVFIKS